MSQPLEVVNDALTRVVQAARRLEEHEEVDRWELADDVREAVDERSDDQNGFGHPEHSHTKTGLYAAIDQVNDALYEAGVISVGRESIVGAYTTAKAWPSEERVEGATYWAHYELRSRMFDGRRQRALQRLVEHSRTGRVGPKDVRLWKSSRQPTAVQPFLYQIEEAVRGALLRKGRPWDKVGDDDRAAINRILRDIGGEIVRGEFGQR